MAADATDDRTAPTLHFVEERLRTLGVGTSRADVALDATLTPETFATTGQEGPPAASASVGPLPRIALSGNEGRAASTVALAPPAAADLEIVGLLGEGGMGRVHLARQRSLGREVAIKTLRDEVADPRTVGMLRAEATTMGRLEHPNIVPVHAVGLDDGGRLLLVMKRIDGVSWRDLLQDPAHPRWATLATDSDDRLAAHLDVLAQVANALHFAHEHGVVHRDVKPDNVLLGSHGEVYLADWGVALRLGDREGPKVELVGTPAYMAPEMVVGERARIDARTDVFLLGATLHEILVGAPPHGGVTLHQVLLAAFEAAPPAYGDDVPRELAAIATRAMSVRAEDRFPSALAFRQALDDVRRHRGSVALVGSGRAILSDVRQVLASQDRAKHAGVDRPLTEARFAFVQALRDWPENLEARSGLDECLRLSIDHELARENAGAAEGLLAELSQPDPELAQTIATMSQRLAARKDEADRLHRLEADQDLSVGFRARAATVVGLIAVAASITAMVFWRSHTGGAAFVTWDTVYISVGVLASVVVPLAILRRRLLANSIGRRISAALVIACVALVAHRAVAALLGVGIRETLAMDTILLASSAATAGLIAPRTAWGALVPLAAAVLVVTFPAHTTTIFSTSSVATLVTVAVLWLRDQRRTRS